MRDGLNDSDDLSPMRRGGIGSMVVLLSAIAVSKGIYTCEGHVISHYSLIIYYTEPVFMWKKY